MIRKIVLGGVVLTITVAVAVYVWLGGFRGEQIERVSHGARIVTGTSYQGAYGDLELRKIFVTTQRYLEENPGLGNLVVVNYDSLAVTKEVNQLIGVLKERTSGTFPFGQTVDTLPKGDYLRVRLYGHTVVRTTPTQVNEKVRSYAADYQLDLFPLVIEHYFSTDSMWVEFPIEID
ncbi:MAG: hypothetical protein ACFB15_17370 [Cyclobacteriaceae bacterium]